MTAAILRTRMSDAERDTRVHLAAAFRAAHFLGWNDSIYNHIAARVPDEPDAFLMNPMGLNWREVQARDLIKSDFDGNYRSPTTRRLAPAGFNFHSAILRDVPNVHCTLHVHAQPVVIVSALEQGLQLFDQGSCVLHDDLAYHDFEGLAQEEEEAPRIIADLGGKRAMIMRNHGGLTVGRTIGEAFYFMQRLVDACDLHARLLATGAAARPVSAQVAAFTKSQIEQRRKGAPYGEIDWAAQVRLAEQLDPAFRALE